MLDSSLLEINNLECVYQKNILAVSEVSLSVKKRQIVALLGTNGAGKTTTLRCIMGKGLLKPIEGEVTKGWVRLNGERIDNKPTHQVVEMGISLVSEGRGILEDMTVEENLRVGAYVLPRRHILKYEKVYSYFPSLEPKRKQIAGYLSGGEQQMLAVGRAIMTTLIILLLDEPSLGLAPRLVDEIFRILIEIRENEGVSILLVEQDAFSALEIVDYGYIMENGRVVLDGIPSELKERPEVKEFYLGVSSAGSRKHYRDVKSYKKRKRWSS